MSRTIKFRAWDKPSKLMRFAKLIGFNLAWDFDKPELFSGKDKNFELMQYTCLKDKQGKEIYEGDIVRTTRETEDRKEDYLDEEVTFGGGAFNPISLQPEETWEVIGNIYENKELLK